VIEYQIAGDGPLRNDLENLIDDLNVNDHVRLLGWKRQEEIVELMKGASILLAPSVTGKDGDQEGIPVTLMESLAQGLPVLSTQHSGIPELVQDGKSGFLVPERDVDALAERLEYLVKHPELWPAMGRAGRDYVERHYDISKLNDQLAQLYQQLLDGDRYNDKAKQGEEGIS
jgi:colanic acid/amylovoran biosynthesis glycosyltransferase